MIIWLASYPKSGNTLVRSMLSTYFFTKDGKFEFETIKNINQFPDLKLFQNYGVDISDDIEIVKNYINVQKQINLKDKSSVRFIKTHSGLSDINGHQFTNLNNSLGVIYIVRDPRSVVKSYANHNQMTLERASNRILEYSDWCIIIFDEPLAGLDKNTRSKIMKMIIKECKKKTVIVITHDQEILPYMDRVINLNELQEKSHPKEGFQNFRTIY